ncbi:nucleotide exchange factor GrpE [Campylobacter magnus]|uniref:nucleotide exchange factor GrpE n=1 Tax=Campylobacter magnus TaxID=3026462 RepID=UPI00236163EB|nr:nucleotide exchange factor GrpE [Campylobacter magnus]MDD0855310.1 nucleotide exchange factor GrpE [Campylobacter magnus]
MKEENKDDLVNFDALKDEQKEQNQPENQEVAQDDAKALAIAMEELANVKTKLIEAHADFENIKKRLEKEKITAVNFANESFARDLLGVIDALEMALNTQISEENEQAKSLKEGVSLTIESFKAALAKHGVKMIETSVGGEFNPEIHNAMSYVESDSIASGFIAQIYQNGYMYNERILRPAMVLIAK